MDRVHGTRSQQVETLLQFGGGAKEATAWYFGTLPREPTIGARTEMTQQMRCWTSSKSVNPNPIFVLALHTHGSGIVLLMSYIGHDRHVMKSVEI
jgi:hypothetical protein